MPLIPKKSAIVDKEALEKEFIILGWKILYHKCLYYELAGNKKFDFLRIDDDGYDAIEKRYLYVAKILGRKPTASEQVGFKQDTPSGTLVLTKILLDEYRAKGRKRCR